jgi:ribosomal protein S18 acetylase RimI-like enzyme
MIEIKALLADQWQLLKQVRCAALEDSPDAFEASLHEALQRSDDDWIRFAEQRSLGEQSINFFAYDGPLACGMAGCVLVGGEQLAAELLSMWVAPTHRRRGAGEALVAQAAAWARGRGAGSLRAGVVESNAAAMQFYRSLGFTDTGDRQPYVRHPARSVVGLALRLDP